jgi:hypothetical protein
LTGGDASFGAASVGVVLGARDGFCDVVPYFFKTESITDYKLLEDPA